MSSGDISGTKSGIRAGDSIAGFVLEIIVANGASTKTEEVEFNLMLTDLYIEAPAIVTGASNKFKLELLTERDNVIYSTGDLVTTAATDHPVHLQRGIRGITKFKITTDGNVNADETFMIEAVGM